MLFVASAEIVMVFLAAAASAGLVFPPKRPVKLPQLLLLWVPLLSEVCLVLTNSTLVFVFGSMKGESICAGEQGCLISWRFNSINQNARPAMPMAKQTEDINTRLLITITKPHNRWWICRTQGSTESGSYSLDGMGHCRTAESFSLRNAHRKILAERFCQAKAIGPVAAWYHPIRRTSYAEDTT